MISKLCKACGEVKNENAFYPSRITRDGLNSYCAECNRLKSRLYAQQNSEMVKAAQARYRRDHRIAAIAHNLVNRSKRLGLKRIRSQPCQICARFSGTRVPGHGHHCDYNKPFDLLWLCPKHHRAWHRIFITEDAK